jgi:hypothetical protein
LRIGNSECIVGAIITITLNNVRMAEYFRISNIGSRG